MQVANCAGTSLPKVGNATEASCSRTENSPTELLNRFHSPLLGVKILTPKTRKEIRHPKHTPIPGAYKHLPSLTANSGYLRSPSKELIGFFVCERIVENEDQLPCYPCSSSLPN